MPQRRNVSVNLISPFQHTRYESCLQRGAPERGRKRCRSICQRQQSATSSGCGQRIPQPAQKWRPAIGQVTDKYLSKAQQSTFGEAICHMTHAHNFAMTYDERARACLGVQQRASHATAHVMLLDDTLLHSCGAISELPGVRNVGTVGEHGCRCGQTLRT